MADAGRRAAAAPARVLVLAKGLGRGGAERLLVETARRLDPERFHVEVAYLLPWKDALVPELAAAGVPVHGLRGAGLRGMAWPLRLRRLVRNGRVDLVHTHMPLPAAVARLVLPGRRPAFVHTEHNLWSRYRWATRWANRLTYRRNAAVVAVSEAVAASIGSTRVPVEVVVHGVELVAPAVDAAARLRARSALGLDPDVPVVGTVGNHTAKKDHATLLDAVARLATDVPDVQLVLVGSGPLTGELGARAQRLGIAERVHLVGSRPDARELLAALDVFALSSRFEGLPLALLEAMAAGLPVVATTVGGVPEVLTDGVDGLLVEPGDAGALQVALGKLLADPALARQLGARARLRAESFDIDRAAERIVGVYETVLSSW